MAPHATCQVADPSASARSAGAAAFAPLGSVPPSLVLRPTSGAAFWATHGHASPCAAPPIAVAGVRVHLHGERRLL